MSELRRDQATGTWTIVAPERSRRPQDRAERDDDADARAGQEYDPDCPFCPGNEAMLPGILDATPRAAPPGWWARAVPNKYPAVRPDSAGTFGYHEVIVEGPRHDGDIARMESDGGLAVVETWQRRYAALFARTGIAAVVLFRNHGARAGASLQHPHAQIVGLGMVPPRLARIAAWAREHHAETGCCAGCDALAAERGDGRRMVDESDLFAAYVPYAAEGPFEVRIVPKHHQASFAEAERGELADFAAMLRRAARRLRGVLGATPYNMVLDSLVDGSPGPASACPWAHWQLRIVPGVNTPGGFELGAGLTINPSSPEADAAALRAVAV